MSQQGNEATSRRWQGVAAIDSFTRQLLSYALRSLGIIAHLPRSPKTSARAPVLRPAGGPVGSTEIVRGFSVLSAPSVVSLSLLSSWEVDGLGGADGDAGVAPIAEAGINEGGLAGVNLQDRLGLADGTGQALATDVALLVVHDGNGRDLCLGEVHHRHVHTPQQCMIPPRGMSIIPPLGPAVKKHCQRMDPPPTPLSVGGEGGGRKEVRRRTSPPIATRAK